MVNLSFRQSKLIIDWHNYGYSILALTAGSGHPLVRFSQLYEHFVGQFASQNICVTEAMRNDLQKRWGICATTLYDRPPQRFRSISLSERHQMFTKLSKSYECFKSVEGKLISSTRFTTQEDNKVMLLPNRPALLISSTSWTEDEDFGLLLDALKQYDLIAKEQQSSNLPKLVCAITGKGPMKDHYKCIIMQTTFDYVEICTPWLEAEDYPILVGCADLGICLHTSSSGLDLPMKVVDMFGCGVPVCAVGFSCLNELVKHGENGLVFDNAEQLTKQLQELLNGFPTAHGLLEKFQENVKEFQKKRWHSCWKQLFHDPVFKNNS
ncbi:chitobiosyldiphosphodolichol beta-mannosyltransferase-like [Xenia sp. Carnegie-2017]|uniref:chitobiosyldiphosphodolichol beta-mannosyltransferase-like n=1 Tax=Xenia sp. Carnegie-2017 TaxID=2897299 RepID=UPI001F037A3F|nr:chitobiosyldiphosphodolichol beta-mannosyltransferase-like [Xenia sp. Carnegie-2017]